MLKNWSESHQKASLTSHVPSPRRRHTANLHQDFLYILGGFDGQKYLNDFHCYNFYTKEWTQLEYIDIPLCGHSSSIYKGKLYVYGGFNGKQYLSTLYEYDFTLKKWTLLTKDIKYLTDRAFHTSVVYKDKLFIFGGYNIFGCRESSVWEFSFKQKLWTKLLNNGTTPAPYKRRNHSAILYKDSMYIFGGFSDKDYFNDFFKFEFSSKSWTEITNHFGNIPSERAVHSCSSENHLMFVVGGFANEKKLNDMYQFNFITYQWMKITPINQENKTFSVRCRHTSTLRKGKLYLFGGTTEQGVSNDLIELEVNSDELRDEPISKCLNIKPDTCIEIKHNKFFAHSFILSQSFVMEQFLKGVSNGNQRRKRHMESVNSTMDPNNAKKTLPRETSSTGSTSEMKTISIRDTSPETFLHVLHYLYGKVLIVEKVSILIELCRASESYKLNHLRSSCLQQLQKMLNESNFDSIYQIVSKLKFTTMLNYLDNWKEKYSKLQSKERSLYSFVELSNPVPLYNDQLKKKLVELYETKELCDLTIITKENISIPCHSYILSSLSEYFYNLLLSTTESTFQIELASDVLGFILEFLYSKSVNFPNNITMDKLIFLYQISETVLKSTDFKEFMFGYIVNHINSETVLETLKCCLKYFIQDRLYDYCLFFVETSGRSVFTKHVIESSLKNEMPYRIREPTISRHKKILSLSQEPDFDFDELTDDSSSGSILLPNEMKEDRKEKRSFRVISFSGQTEQFNKLDELQMKLQTQEKLIQNQNEIIQDLLQKQRETDEMLKEIISQLQQK